VAKKEAQLILKIKQIGAEGIKKVKDSFGSLRAKVIGGALAMTAGLFSLKKAFDFAHEAAKLEGVKSSFTALAASQGKDADQMLEKMRELSAGTVSDLKLMQSANQALLLGLPVDRFGDMLTIARSAAAATGQSMDFMLNSIVTGLGRGSKLMLDNLGIVFKIEDAYKEYAESLDLTASELTEAQKKQAFINKALEVGADNAKKAGSSGLSLTDKWAQLQAATDNLSKSMGKGLVPIFESIVGMSTQVVNFFNRLTKGTDLSSLTVDQLDKKIEKLTIKLRKMADQKIDFGEEFKKTVLQLNTLTEARRTAQAKLDKIAEGKRLNDLEEKEAELLAQQEHDFKMIEQANDAAAIAFELQNATGSKKIALQIKLLDKQIKNENKFHKKKELAEKKAILTSDLMAAQSAEAQKKIEEEKKKEILANTRTFLSQAATLSHSGNKRLVAIGKAAAMIQIAIDTEKAASAGFSLGMSLGGPPLAAAFGAIAIAAGATRMASVAGIQLADGGIVQARQGGTPAILGEGGRDEAVIPLDSAGGDAGLGTTININAGAMLGDESQAREFAEVIDRELLKLRQDNSSLAFDTDII
jgi:hypothetical protein